MKRGTPMKRTPFRTKREGPAFHVELKPRAEARPAAPKARRCDWEKCGKEFTPARPMQNVCSPRCATARQNAIVAQREAEAAELTRAERERLKTRGELQAEAQGAFNAYIRYRDRNTTCVDCGKPFEPQKPGGSMDAGHYLARSVAPHLRFNEDNVAGQRKNCNRPGGTTRSAFRAGLVERIGEDRVRALETDHSVRKFTQDDFRKVRDTYRAKLKAEKAKAG